MDEVRRDDDHELCGFIEQRGAGWQGLTVFGVAFGEHDDEEGARRHVVQSGLATLADRWTLIDGTSGAEQVVCIAQASPTSLTVSLGYYSDIAVPVMTISAADLSSGRWQLEHRS